MNKLPPGWHDVLSSEVAQPYFHALTEFVDAQRQSHEIYPPVEDVYNALKLTPYDKVRVLILGQDPYHDAGQAHGLAFSVRNGVRPPPSLVNIFKELRSDLDLPMPSSGNLTPWAERGVLLLNAVLTVRAHEPNSHKGKGWEQFTDAIIQKVSAKSQRVVFILWGGYAQRKEKLIDTTAHTILKSAHPSPLSVRAGFFGSRPFSKANAALQEAGEKPIDWRLG